MIIYKKVVVDYLDDLIFDLYIGEYFGFIESSEVYVDKIIDFILNNIQTFPAKPTPLKLQYLGKKYIFYKPNHRTTWYIF